MRLVESIPRRILRRCDLDHGSLSNARSRLVFSNEEPAAGLKGLLSSLPAERHL